MFEYYIHSILLVLFGAFLADTVGISNPKFWMIFVTLVGIIFTIVDNDSEDDDED